MSVMSTTLVKGNHSTVLQSLFEMFKRMAILYISLMVISIVTGSLNIIVRIWPVPITAAVHILLTLLTTESLTAMAIACCLEWYWWLRRDPREIKRTYIAIAGMIMAWGVAVWLLMVLPIPNSALFDYGLAASPLDFWLFIVWHTIVWGIILIVYLARKHQVFEQDTRIAIASREWERARRAVLESRLQAIQARVEPQLLFDSLARLRQRYGTGIEEGEVLLEALIDFLRCGLPHMRAAMGTVFLECELLKSYALLLRSAAFSQPILHCDVDPETAATTIAAGGLQGLVAPWMRSISNDRDEIFEIVARRTRDGVWITITGPVADLTVEALTTKQTLREIHGPMSSISHRQLDRRLQYRIEYCDGADRPITNPTLADAHG